MADNICEIPAAAAEIRRHGLVSLPVQPVSFSRHPDDPVCRRGDRTGAGVAKPRNPL